MAAFFGRILMDIAVKLVILGPPFALILGACLDANRKERWLCVIGTLVVALIIGALAWLLLGM